jgi:hypothetical protein
MFVSNGQESNGMTDEEHKHKCEVRYWIKLRKEKGLQEFRRLISTYGLGDRRPSVMRDIQDQYTKGNTGKEGDWR